MPEPPLWRRDLQSVRRSSSAQFLVSSENGRSRGLPLNRFRKVGPIDVISGFGCAFLDWKSMAWKKKERAHIHLLPSVSSSAAVLIYIRAQLIWIYELGWGADEQKTRLDGWATDLFLS